MLRQRLKASDVREQLGLPRGQLINKGGGGDDFPDVIWRLEFADMAAQDADMKVRATSPEFEAIRHDMRQLYRRFERPLYAPCRDGDTAPLRIGPQQTLLLYGVYCEESIGAAACDILGSKTASGLFRTVKFISGGKNIPQILCETRETGIPQAASAALDQLPVRIRRSLWQTADYG